MSQAKAPRRRSLRTLLTGHSLRALPRRRKLGITAFVALAAAALGVGGPVGYVAAASATHLHSADDANPAPVALVLGAGLAPGGGPSPALAARLDIAKKLLDAGKVKVILVSGDNRTADHNEPDAMAAYLRKQGVGAHQVVADYAGRDTYASCYRAQAIFGVQDVIVVSQDFHVPRAVATCESLGMTAQGVGDTTFRDIAPDQWIRGWVREVPAAVKMSAELISRREPVLGNRESGVDDALAAS